MISRYGRLADSIFSMTDSKPGRKLCNSGEGKGERAREGAWEEGMRVSGVLEVKESLGTIPF